MYVLRPATLAGAYHLPSRHDYVLSLPLSQFLAIHQDGDNHALGELQIRLSSRQPQERFQTVLSKSSSYPTQIFQAQRRAFFETIRAEKQNSQLHAHHRAGAFPSL